MKNNKWIFLIIFTLLIAVLGILLWNSKQKEEVNNTIEDKIEENFIKLYNENSSATLNDDYIILCNGLEIEKKTGIQYEDYMKITDENKTKYEIKYYNYEKEKAIGETIGIFGRENIYDGYSYVENVSRIAISKEYNAIPRTAIKIEELPDKLQEFSDYTNTSIEKIDLDGDGNPEYVVCVNQYTKAEDYDQANNETYSEIMLFDKEFNKIATLASWKNEGVQELSKEMCLQLDNVIYLDIENDNNMEILVELPAYDSTLLSIFKYSNNKLEGEVDYKVNVEP